MNKELLELIGAITGVVGFILWLILILLLYFYTLKILKSISNYLHNDENYYEQGFSLYDLSLMCAIMNTLFYQYHLFYKRNGRLPMFEKGHGLFYSNLDLKNAIFLIQKHPAWILLNAITLFTIALSLLISFILFWLADN